MIQRPAPRAQTRRLRDSAVYELERVRYRAVERATAREPRRHRGRERAARSMRAVRVDARALKEKRVPAVCEDIGELAAAEVPALVARHEQVHVWGSAALLQALFAADVVDQVNLWISPVVVGQGKRLWPSGTTPSLYLPAEPATTFPAGATLLRYRRVEGAPQKTS